jgi:hypothetical protein
MLVALSGAIPPIASLMTTHTALAPMCWEATWGALVALSVFTITKACVLLVAVVGGRLQPDVDRAPVIGFRPAAASSR